MPLEIEHQSRRHGDGWVTYISPTQLTMILDDADESAGNRALADLCTWGDPTDWTLEASGWNDDNTSYYIYEWHPA